MATTTKAPSPEFLRLRGQFLGEFDYDSLELLRLQIEGTLNQATLKIDQEAASRAAGTTDEDKLKLEALGDEAEVLREMRQEAQELMIVALYKKLELQRKALLRRFFPTLVEQRLSDISYLEEVLPFDLKRVVHYAEVDELRLINNAVKHEGKVSPTLASRYSSHHGSAGSPLDRLDEHFERLAPGVRKHLRGLATESVSNFGTPLRPVKKKSKTAKKTKKKP